LERSKLIEQAADTTTAVATGGIPVDNSLSYIEGKLIWGLLQAGYITSPYGIAECSLYNATKATFR